MVSIIIVAKEYSIKLAHCIDSVNAQICHESIQTIVETRGNIATARKKAIEKADGRYICFVDGDQILPPNLIQNCVDMCELGWDGVTWTERGLNHNTFCEKVIDYDKELFHQAQDDDPIHGAAEPRFFKAEFVKRLNFDKLPPVTFELSMINKQINNMGAKIGFINTIVYHQEPKSFRELFSKFFRYGYYYIPSLKYDRMLVANHSKPRRVYFTLRALRKPLFYTGLWLHYFIKATAALGGAIWYLLLQVGTDKQQAI